MNAKIKLTSIENTSLIRKFTIMFIVMSFMPFLVICFLFLKYYIWNEEILDRNTLLVLLYFTGIGALAGFYGMRKSIIKIKNVTDEATRLLVKNIPNLKDIKQGDSEISQLTRTFSEVTQGLENNIKRLEASKRAMQYVLSKLASGISSLQNIDTFLDLIVEITTDALDAKTGILMLLDEEKQELYVKSITGNESDAKNMRIKVGDEAVGWVAKHKKPLLVPELNKADAADPGIFAPPFLSAPMLYQERLVGVLTVAGKLSGRNFEEDEMVIISNLASQTAVAVENERLHMDAERTYLDTMSALAIAVEARDPYSRGHSDRVSKYAVKVAEKLGLSEVLIKEIKTAGELHDIGKIGISDNILKKTSPLTEDEMIIMRKHSAIGESVVKPVHSLTRVCGVIRSHHEWLDGSGYPDRLKADQIPFAAKILAVVDSFDAMTSDRPYRKALSYDMAKEDLKKYIDIRYDRNIVEAFISLV